MGRVSDTSNPSGERANRVLTVTGEAMETVLAARAGESTPERLALFVEVSGESGGSYTYDIWFEAAADAAPDDEVEAHGQLLIVVPRASVDRLRGATLDVGADGLVLLNPNTPNAPVSPAGPPPESYGDLTGPLAVAVLEVLEQEVNPQIATHGGRADLAGVDAEGVAYVLLSGGCQGCGLAAVTLSQGISVAIQEAVPGITQIVDVTAHASGSNPYYQAAKK